MNLISFVKKKCNSQRSRDCVNVDTGILLDETSFQSRKINLKDKLNLDLNNLIDFRKSKPCNLMIVILAYTD